MNHTLKLTGNLVSRLHSRMLTNTREVRFFLIGSFFISTQ